MMLCACLDPAVLRVFDVFLISLLTCPFRLLLYFRVLRSGNVHIGQGDYFISLVVSAFRREVGQAPLLSTNYNLRQ